ncbi:hypothetical protein ACQP0C_40760 [Nocardia sp. CA-129566]|uniref:hypothetical protein n=1 Tax=Nocardia sp. CA-129566 TaxID=3239976 RepID=UPI003D96C00C
MDGGALSSSGTASLQRAKVCVELGLPPGLVAECVDDAERGWAESKASQTMVGSSC